MAKGKLAIGYLHRFESLDPWFHHSIREVIDEDWRTDRRIRGREIGVACGPLVAQGRNDLVRAFLAHRDRPDWLLMVDADMTFTPSDVRNIFNTAHEKERPVVGGLCFAVSAKGIWPTLYRFLPDGRIGRLDGYPRNQLIRVDATGGAFILIHRNVLVRLEETCTEQERACPWFAEVYGADGRPFGEDVTFCARLKRIDVPVHAHTGIKIGHMKMICVNEDYYDMVRPKADVRVEVPPEWKAS